MRQLILILTVSLWCNILDHCEAAERILEKKLHHLRIEGEREWTEFPEKAEAMELSVEFAARTNATEYALRLRQQDVKQTWKITLNDKEIGRLHRNENDMIAYWPIPVGSMLEGDNHLIIRQAGDQVDDIRVGDVRLYDRPIHALLNRHAITVDTGIPCRITVVDHNGSLQMVGTSSNESLAVRPGVIYCNGRARFGLPSGNFTVFCGRGFEYGITRTALALKHPGEERQSIEIQASIPREVPTPGLVSCDTHVHTFTHSGHGDASMQERMLTLAGENIELAIATDHNVHIDYEHTAREMNLRKYFTPVIGNEVTTKIGHFNVFPIQAGAAIPDFKLKDWQGIFRSINATPNVKVVIMNHARDVHAGYRAFGPKHHLSVTGENLDGWELKANAMEVINSGATQTDVMQLYRDWFGLLNRGFMITPVGSSDSHDVARHFVGQGRTYIQCDDRDPENIDVASAVDAIVNGRVMVSYGLLATILVDQEYGPGELADISQSATVSVRVLGPSWTTAERVELYANGQLVRQAAITDGNKPGVKWRGEWELTDLKHDVHLVALARGPGVKALYWPTAKPYQPSSPSWESYVVGSTGAVWLDGDGDKKRTSAFEYAERLVKQSKGNVNMLLESLNRYDAAVAAQAASMLQATGTQVTGPAFRKSLSSSSEPVQRGVNAYIEAWHASQIARSE